jgi:carbohydrate-selective porin OprB
MNVAYASLSLGKFRLGWSDLSIEFNTNDPSADFINSSFGTSADLGNTGFAGPSIYPVPTFGIDHLITHKEGFYFRSAVMSAIVSSMTDTSDLLKDIYLSADNHTIVTEVGVEEKNKFEYALGVWSVKSGSEVLLPFSQKGLYFQADYKVNGGLHPFLRWGRSSKVSARVYSNVALGLEFAFDNKKLGSLGFGFSSARIDSAPFSEKVYELIYKNRIHRDLSLVVSTQFIFDPSGESGEAFAGTLRLVYNKDWI